MNMILGTPDPTLAREAINRILAQQEADGGPAFPVKFNDVIAMQMLAERERKEADDATE